MKIRKYLIIPKYSKKFILSINEEDRYKCGELISKYMNSKVGNVGYDIIPLDDLKVVEI